LDDDDVTLIVAQENRRSKDNISILLLHCCYTAVTLLLHCCYTVPTLLLTCRYTVVTHCYTVVTR
jgi:hypothetical protein